MFRIYLLCCVLLLTAGCVSNIDEDHIYLARNDETGDFSLVKVSIQGRGEMTDLEYQASWREASAVDQAFRGKINDAETTMKEGEQTDQIAVMQDGSVEIILGKIKALAGDTSLDNQKKILALENQLVQMLSLKRRITARETYDVPEAPKEKFVIVMSSNPSAVFQAISAIAANQANQGATLGMIQALTDQRLSEKSQANIETDILAESMFAQPVMPSPVDVSGTVTATDVQASTAKLENLKVRLQQFIAATEQ